MNYNHSFLIPIISFIVLVSPLYGMDICKKTDANDNNAHFEQYIELIQNSCDKKIFTDEHHHALIQITSLDNPNNIKKHIKTTAYKTFQQLDLSHIIDALNKDDRYQFKPWEGTTFFSALDKVTLFRLTQGMLAKHNTSVVYLTQQTPIFSEKVLSHIESMQYENSFKATYIRTLNDAKLGSLPMEHEILAELQQQEICLINNTKNKKTLQQESTKTNNWEPKKEIGTQQQPAMQSNIVIVTNIPEHAEQLIDLSSVDSDINQSKEKIEIIKQQTDKKENTKENIKPKDQPTMKLLFSKTFFINGIKLTLFAMFIYYMWHHKFSAIGSYL